MGRRFLILRTLYFACSLLSASCETNSEALTYPNPINDPDLKPNKSSLESKVTQDLNSSSNEGLISPRNRRGNAPDRHRNSALSSLVSYNERMLQNFFQSQPKNAQSYFLNLLMPLGRRPTRYSDWDSHSVMHFGKRSLNSDDDIKSTGNTLNFSEEHDEIAEGDANTPFENVGMVDDSEKRFKNRFKDYYSGIDTSNKKVKPHGEEFELEKKSEIPWNEHSTMHFGKRENEPWHDMLSFGKKSDNPWYEHNTLHFGKRDDSWHDMMSFGKRDDSWHDMMSFGKRDDSWHDMMSFGKKSENSGKEHDNLSNGENLDSRIEESKPNKQFVTQDANSPIDTNKEYVDPSALSDEETANKRDVPLDHNTLHFGKKADSWDAHNTLHFGKKSNPFDSHNMMYFGKKSSDWDSQNTMHFGKKSWDDHNTMHFGKKSWNDHSTMHFGKRFTDMHDTMHFGKKNIDGGIQPTNFQSADMGNLDSNMNYAMSYNGQTSNENTNLSKEKVITKRSVKLENISTTDKINDVENRDLTEKSLRGNSQIKFNLKGKENSSDTGFLTKNNEANLTKTLVGKRHKRSIKGEGKKLNLNGNTRENQFDNSDVSEHLKHVVMANSVHRIQKRSITGKETDDEISNQANSNIEMDKRNDDSWMYHNTLHFGKKEDPWNTHSTMHFGKRPDPWENHNTMHFGKKWDDFGGHDTMHFGKKFDPWELHNTMHFGKRSDPWENHNTMHFGKKSEPWGSHNTMHFGKKSDPWENHSTMHFGKKSDPWENHSTMHFGKKSDPWENHSTMHFGKKSDTWENHNTLHFGKKSDNWDDHSTMHFGKRNSIVPRFPKTPAESDTQNSYASIQKDNLDDTLQLLDPIVRSRINDYIDDSESDLLSKEFQKEAPENLTPSYFPQSIESSMGQNSEERAVFGISPDGEIVKPEAAKRYLVPFQGARSIVFPHAWFASQIRRSSFPKGIIATRSYATKMEEKKEDPVNSYMHFGRR